MEKKLDITPFDIMKILVEEKLEEVKHAYHHFKLYEVKKLSLTIIDSTFLTLGTILINNSVNTSLFICNHVLIDLYSVLIHPLITHQY